MKKQIRPVFLLLCFSCCYDKIPEKSSLREGFVLAPGSRDTVRGGDAIAVRMTESGAAAACNTASSYFSCSGNRELGLELGVGYKLSGLLPLAYFLQLGPTS